MTPAHKCPVCDSEMPRGLASWHFVCACGHESSNLQPVIVEATRAAAIDEGLRETGLKTLREQNFRTLIAFLSANGLRRGAHVLDVGCAHGWFLQALDANGFRALGIEPDENVVSLRGTVRRGFFPQAVEPGESFDAITFNDVFEHLPRPDEFMAACHALVRPGGFLLINGPDKRGPIYRTARLLRRLGVGIPFDRMWQAGLPSPHLSYFDQDSLRRLAAKSGLEFVAAVDLPSITRTGLWHRIRYTDTPLPVAAAVFAGLHVLKPLLDRMSSDTSAVLFRKSTGD